MEDNTFIDERTIRNAREATPHSTGTPEWTNPLGFEKDVFTFARVLFRSEAEPGEEADALTVRKLGGGDGHLISPSGPEFVDSVGWR